MQLEFVSTLHNTVALKGLSHKTTLKTNLASSPESNVHAGEPWDEP